MPLKIKMTQVALLVPYAANARTHSEQQIAQIAGNVPFDVEKAVTGAAE